MTNSLIIQPLTAAQIPQVMALWLRTFEYHHQLDAVYYRTPGPQLTAEVEAYLTAALRDGKMVSVAWQNSVAVGLIIYFEEMESYFDTNIRRFGYISELFVSSECRGQGIGQGLLAVAEEEFRRRGQETVKLAASAFNQDAIRFYTSLGYIDRQHLLFKQLK